MLLSEARQGTDRTHRTRESMCVCVCLCPIAANKRVQVDWTWWSVRTESSDTQDNTSTEDTQQVHAHTPMHSQPAFCTAWAWPMDRAFCDVYVFHMTASLTPYSTMQPSEHSLAHAGVRCPRRRLLKLSCVALQGVDGQQQRRVAGLAAAAARAVRMWQAQGRALRIKGLVADTSSSSLSSFSTSSSLSD